MNNHVLAPLRGLLILLVFLALLRDAAPSPSAEFRGIWALSTFDPPPTVNGPADYDRLFDNLETHGFNNVIFYVMCYAMANYPSRYLPWNAALDVPVGVDPGWDPLEYAIEQAHARSMPLHAKINAFLAYRVSTPLTDRADLVINVHPDWICVGPDGEPMTNSTDHLFFNPCHPAVQQWIYDICLEVVGRYAIDGLHFDYVRFPSPAYSWDPVTLNRFWARYGKSPAALPAEWTQWRRDQITGLLLRIKTAVCRDHWNILFAADVWERPESGARSVLQDAERWREMHIVDFDAPMLYTTDLARFEEDLADHQARAHGRFVFPGIGAYLMSNPVLLDQQITAARDHATSGVVLFKDQALFPNGQPNAMAEYLRTHLFQEPAPSPIFPWKTKTEFDPPAFAGLETAEPRPSMAVLRWQPADDASGPVTYTIYSSTASAGQDFQLPDWATQDTEFLMEGLENGVNYYFVVRAEDQFGNEEGNLTELSVVPLESVSFSIEDFESDGGLGFLGPNDSTLSIGLDPASELVATEETPHGGESSGELRLVWADPIQGQCLLAAQPPEPRFPDFTGWCSLWVYGTGDGTRLAAVFRDTDLKRTSWVTVDWSGWRQVEWFLPRTSFTPLIEGGGKLTGGILGGAFAGLLFLPGTEEESHLFLDDLENQLRPDPFPPDFSGLKSLIVAGSTANLSWSMGMDADNPITYNIYRSSSPESFDFSSPVGKTPRLSHSLPLLSSWTDSYFVVRAEDLNGNVDDNRVVLGTSGAAPIILESFEAGTPSYWNGDPDTGIIFQSPNFSGTTQGVQESSGWVIETTPVVHGRYSGRLQIDWEDVPERFCRITTYWVRPAIEDFRGTLSVWVYGDGSHTRMATVILDNQHEGAGDLEYERTPWITIDWVGWRKLEWVLPEVSWSSQWNRGTGALEDLAAGGLFDGFIFEPGVGSSAALLFDCLQLGPLPQEKGFLEVY